LVGWRGAWGWKLLAIAGQYRVEVNRDRGERLVKPHRVWPSSISVGAGDGGPAEGVIDPSLKAVIEISVGIPLGPGCMNEVGMHAPARSIVRLIGGHYV
jgi:hypothetical protein